LPEDGSEAEAAWIRERAALKWLEEQEAPEMNWPEASPRDVVKVYVPVNDPGLPQDPDRVKASEMRAALGVLPDQRSRQERTFPASYVGGGVPDRQVFLQWPNARPSSEVFAALTDLARKVTRIGHSSSLTMVWVAQASEVPPAAYRTGIKSSDVRRNMQLRVPSAGFLEELDGYFNADDIEAFFDLSNAITIAKGSAKEQAKAAFEKRFGTPWRRTASPPVRLRPVAGRTLRYSPVEKHDDSIALSTFDSELLVLDKREGPVLGLEGTASLTAALRGYLLKDCEGKPEWFTGHTISGTASTGGHMALFPLSFVGSEHADGHVLGLAIAFPRNIPPAERAACLRNRLFDPDGKDIEIELKMGNLGTWTVCREERGLPPIALRTETWCEPSTVWASVTPIVLDRHPKHDRRNERIEWREEVIASIAQSCERQGLPEPVIIDVDKTSWHRGAPRSKPGPGGMPWLPGKEGVAPRQQVHALIQFPCEVQGPILLGAGRFRGYGLCKPLGRASK
jgi:CRISPR-associated protein Csb2